MAPGGGGTLRIGREFTSMPFPTSLMRRALPSLAQPDISGPYVIKTPNVHHKNGALIKETG